MASSVFAASSSVSIACFSDSHLIVYSSTYSVFPYVYCPSTISTAFTDRHTVYPETKGVPLEEMDAVFGEGESIRLGF